jgi:SAM-dependent methyltransferase
VCHQSVLEWFRNLVNNNPDEFNDKRILEVGSRDVNGSVRPIIEELCSPKEYVGIDIEEGKFVDLVLPAEKAADYFGEETFDVVISTEMLEHVKDWRLVINNMKNVLRADGMIYITTRSFGFKFHEYPFDYWRYEEIDMKKIFSDFKIISVKNEGKTCPGVFVKAMKTSGSPPPDLWDISLYSMVTNKRTKEIPD